MPSFSETLKQKLPKEMYIQLLDALGDDFDMDLVPRARLNQVIRQRNELREQLSGASAASGADDDDDLDAESKGKTKKKDPAAPPAVTANVEELEQKHQAAMRELSLRYAVLNKLQTAGAIDPELIYNAKLIDLSKVTDGEGGAFVGLDEAIKVLVENKDRAYLFGSNVPAGTGKTGGKGGDDITVTIETYKAMTYNERLKFKEEHPEQYALLMKTKG